MAAPKPPKLLPRKKRRSRTRKDATPIPEGFIRRMLSLPGMTKTDVARLLGIAPQSLDDRLASTPALAAEVELGLTQRRLTAANALNKAVSAGKVPAVLFVAKAVLGMTETPLAPAGAHGSNFLVETRPKAASLEEWQEEYGPLRAGQPKGEG